MLRIAVRVVVNAVALWVAAALLGGIILSSNFGSVLIVAIVFGLINAFIKPIAQILNLPFMVLTLGFFTLVVNAAMLSLTDYLSDSLNVDGFWNSMAGALIVSIISWMLSVFVPDEA